MQTNEKLNQTTANCGHIKMQRCMFRQFPRVRVSFNFFLITAALSWALASNTFVLPLRRGGALAMAVPRAKARLSEALTQGQSLKRDQLQRLFGDEGVEILNLVQMDHVTFPLKVKVLDGFMVVFMVASQCEHVRYAHVKANEAGEVQADHLLEWLYGDGQGAKMLPHLEVPVAPGGESPSAKSGSFSPRHCRTEKDIDPCFCNKFSLVYSKVFRIAVSYRTVIFWCAYLLSWGKVWHFDGDEQDRWSLGWISGYGQGSFWGIPR